MRLRIVGRLEHNGSSRPLRMTANYFRQSVGSERFVETDSAQNKLSGIPSTELMLLECARQTIEDELVLLRREQARRVS